MLYRVLLNQYVNIHTVEAVTDHVGAVMKTNVHTLCE